MNIRSIKIGALAAVTALTLALPAAALAQPGYGSSYRVERDFRRDEFRREERQREFRRAEEARRLRWEREHARYGYGSSYYR